MLLHTSKIFTYKTNGNTCQHWAGSQNLLVAVCCSDYISVNKHVEPVLANSSQYSVVGCCASTSKLQDNCPQIVPNILTMMDKGKMCVYIYIYIRNKLQRVVRKYGSMETFCAYYFIFIFHVSSAFTSYQQ